MQQISDTPKLDLVKKCNNLWRDSYATNFWHYKAKFLIDWLLEASRRPVQNSYVCKLWHAERKKLSHFDIKNWVTG